MANKGKRLHIELSDKYNNTITEIAKKENTSKVEIIKRALYLYKIIYDAVESKGKKLAIISKDSSKIEKEIIFVNK